MRRPNWVFNQKLVYQPKAEPVAEAFWKGNDSRIKCTHVATCITAKNLMMTSSGSGANIAVQIRKDLYISAQLSWYLFSIAVIVGFIALVGDVKFFATMSGLLKTNHIGGEVCLFCGMTRALIAISHGDFEEALLYNRYSLGMCIFLFANTAMFANSIKNLIKIRKF